MVTALCVLYSFQIQEHIVGSVPILSLHIVWVLRKLGFLIRRSLDQEESHLDMIKKKKTDITQNFWKMGWNIITGWDFCIVAQRTEWVCLHVVRREPNIWTNRCPVVVPLILLALLLGAYYDFTAPLHRRPIKHEQKWHLSGPAGNLKNHQSFIIRPWQHASIQYSVCPDNLSSGANIHKVESQLPSRKCRFQRKNHLFF